MKGIARSQVWWPVESIVHNCDACQGLRVQPPVMQLRTWPSGPYIDFAGPFMGSMFLIVVDACSKVAGGDPYMGTVSAGRTVEVFFRYGVPQVVVSDNGPQFTTQEFGDLM